MACLLPSRATGEGCNKAPVSGVTRNDNGRIDIEFTRLIGEVPIPMADMAAGSEIRFARTKKIRNIKVGSDAI